MVATPRLVSRHGIGREVTRKELFLASLPLLPIWPAQIDIDGVKVSIRHSPLSAKLRRRLMRGFYETAERELIGAFIRRGDQVLEIGASVGIVTCFLAKSVGNDGRIVSVEANPSLRSHFELQLWLNGVQADLLDALCCPLWNQSIPESLLSQSFIAAKNTLSGRIARTGPGTSGIRWITAEVACSETRLEPTALVVDIEGTEAVWTEHSPQFPKSLRTIILEVHPHLIGVKQAGRVVQVVVDEGFHMAGIRNQVFAFQRK